MRLQPTRYAGPLSPSREADERVFRYAPLVRFADGETCFPIDPALFVARAGLRRCSWAPDVPDAVWDPRRARWEPLAVDRPVPPHAQGPDLAAALVAMDIDAPLAWPGGRNRRPRDPENRWGGRRAGYALELVEPLGRDLRGGPARVPVLLYEHEIAEGPGGRFDVITYWFFYALHLGPVVREGDWQRVSVVLPPADGVPRVRFGADDVGLTARFDAIERVADTHPVVYVGLGEHGCHRTAMDARAGAGGWSTRVETWRLPVRRVGDVAWAGFDGAWGLVGPTESSTGPLGPAARP